jgi:hypothetical protein
VNADSEPLEPLVRLARESGEILGELGVRPGDERWIREHAETIASLTRRSRQGRLFAYFRRLALRAARKAR